MQTVQLQNETSSAIPDPAITDKLPPIAPGWLPLLGHLVPLVLRPLSFLQSVRSQGDIVRFSIGQQPVYMVNSPDLIHRVLVTQAADFEQGRLLKNARALVGDSLVTTDGPVHQKQRRFMQAAFHRERVAHYAKTMAEIAAAKTASWQPGQNVAVTKEMLDLALTVVTHTLFTADAGTIDTAEVQRLLTEIMGGIAWRMVSSGDLLEKLPIPANRRFNTANARLRQIVGDVITAYRADGRDRGDLLSMLLLARDQHTGEGMTDRQVHDEIVELTVAGYEQTGVTLAWFFHELGQNPHVEKRIHMEIDAVLGGRPARYEDVPALEYTRRALTETLRLHHPIWGSMRRAIRPVTVNGVHLPAGAEVFFSMYSLHRDPVIYPDPLVFDPDRWLPERARERSRYAFLPFGAGKHTCIGEGFAWVEMILSVATIASQWRLRPVSNPSVRELAYLVVQPDRLTMTAIPR